MSSAGGSSRQQAGSTSSRPHAPSGKPAERRGGSSREAQTITLHENHSLLQEKSKGGFICKMKFSNELPDLPFEPKFLEYPFDPSRLTRYKPTMLEKMHKYTLLTEPDLGIHIDLIDPEAYEPPAEGAQLLPEDADLLRDEEKAKKHILIGSDGQARPNVPWLHKTAYYGNDDLYGMNQGGAKIKELPVPILEEMKERTADELQALIDEGFDLVNGTEEEVAQVLKHPKNPSLEPVAVYSLFPDFQRWANDYTEIVFDQDPALDDVEVREGLGPESRKRRAALGASGMIHFHEIGDKKKRAYAYMVPAPGSSKRKRVLAKAVENGDADDEMEEDQDEVKYQCLREYCENEARMFQEEWRDDHFVFALVEGGEDLQALYHPIKARTYLRKDKECLTRHQMATLMPDTIRKLVKQGKRYPKHDEVVVKARELADQEKEDMREARWAIEGDPLLKHDSRAGGASGGGKDSGEDGREAGDGGAVRRSTASSSSSSSSEDEAATPKPGKETGAGAASNDDDDDDKSDSDKRSSKSSTPQPQSKGKAKVPAFSSSSDSDSD